MTVRKDPSFVSVEDYLKFEIEAEERHEYVAGEVVEMAGANEYHEIVALNLSAALLGHMRGKGCRVFKGDLKVRLQLNSQELFYYPDVMVVCDKSDSDKVYKTKPKVIVEVMSDYKKDHVEKLFAYQQIEALQEYLVIDQNPDNQRAWIYRRDKNWAQEDGAPDGNVVIQELDFQIPLSELYVME